MAEGVVADVTGSTVVRGSGVFLDSQVCSQLWPSLRKAKAELEEKAAQTGGQVPAGFSEAVDHIRSAALDWFAWQQRNMSPNRGTSLRTSQDITSPSRRDEPQQLTTLAASRHLRCSPRHVRRLALKHGIEPCSPVPFRWKHEDIALLDAHRNHSA